jgi:Flp pilus assembly pilin Flp
MKKFFSKLMKDTRGVVMMEYIVLGLFAVAVTVVAVQALGKTYNNGLLVMAEATVGETANAAAMLDDAKGYLMDDSAAAENYATAMTNQGTSVASAVDYPIYL